MAKRRICIRRFFFCTDAANELAVPAKASQDSNRLARLRAECIIEINARATNNVPLIDHVTRRHRQFPGGVAIEFREIHIEFSVDSRQVIRQVKNNSKTPRDFVLGVAENVKREMQFLHRRGRMF